jgi:hypothetical protein
MTSIPQSLPRFRAIIGPTDAAAVEARIEQTVLAWSYPECTPWGHLWWTPPTVKAWNKPPNHRVVSVGGPAHIFRTDGSGFLVRTKGSWVELRLSPLGGHRIEIDAGVCCDVVEQDPEVSEAAPPLFDALIKEITRLWLPETAPNEAGTLPRRQRTAGYGADARAWHLKHCKGLSEDQIAATLRTENVTFASPVSKLIRNGQASLIRRRATACLVCGRRIGEAGFRTRD